MMRKKARRESTRGIFCRPLFCFSPLVLSPPAFFSPPATRSVSSHLPLITRHCLPPLHANTSQWCPEVQETARGIFSVRAPRSGRAGIPILAIRGRPRATRVLCAASLAACGPRTPVARIGFCACSHVEAVARLDLPAFAAIAQYAAARSRRLKRNRFGAIELSLIPIHFAQRKNLACEELLCLFRVL
jgi:hypothetical protein